MLIKAKLSIHLPQEREKISPEEIDIVSHCRKLILALKGGEQEGAAVGCMTQIAKPFKNTLR